VIAIDRTLRPELGANARDRGVEWSIDLGIASEHLVDVIREAVAGTLEDSASARAWEANQWPGQRLGLSGQESAVLQRIVVGRSNLEIADELFLSINSVKTYIRSTYRKIGARDRGRAVAWAIEHGFPTDRQ
jgi:DNA-binding NarL/FixJ family response regulator